MWRRGGVKANGEKEGGGSSKRKGRKRKTGERKEKWRESKGEGGKEGEPEKKEKGRGRNPKKEKKNRREEEKQNKKKKKQKALPPVKVPAAAKWKFRSKPYCGSESLEIEKEKRGCPYSLQPYLIPPPHFYWATMATQNCVIVFFAKEP